MTSNVGLYDPAKRDRTDCKNHTPCPEGYLAWHSWAEKMSKTHKQRKCKGCGLFTIWEPKKKRARRGGER